MARLQKTYPDVFPALLVVHTLNTLFSLGLLMSMERLEGKRLGIVFSRPSMSWCSCPCKWWAKTRKGPV